MVLKMAEVVPGVTVLDVKGGTIRLAQHFPSLDSGMVGSTAPVKVQDSDETECLVPSVAQGPTLGAADTGPALGLVLNQRSALSFSLSSPCCPEPLAPELALLGVTSSWTQEEGRKGDNSQRGHYSGYRHTQSWSAEKQALP